MDPRKANGTNRGPTLERWREEEQASARWLEPVWDLRQGKGQKQALHGRPWGLALGFGDTAPETLAYGADRRADTPMSGCKGGAERTWQEKLPAAGAVPGVRQGDIASIQGQGRLDGGP